MKSDLEKYIELMQSFFSNITITRDIDETTVSIENDRGETVGFVFDFFDGKFKYMYAES